MTAKFKKYFKEKSTSIEISNSVISALSDDLPGDITYKKTDSEFLIVNPEFFLGNPKESQFKFNLPAPDRNNAIFKEFFPGNVMELSRFLYNTQQSYEVEISGEESSIKLDEGEIPFDKLIISPYSMEKSKYKIKIEPEKFPDPFPVVFDFNGMEETFQMQRMPLADIRKQRYESINVPFYKISYDLIEKDGKYKLVMSYSFDLSDTNDVEDYVKAYKMFYACISSAVKFNGTSFQIKIPNFNGDKESVEVILKFWEKVTELEKLLGIKFKVKNDVSFEESLAIEELYISLISNKPFKNYVKIEELTLKPVSDKDEIFDLVGEEKSVLSFKQKEKVEIFCSEIEVLMIICFYNMKIEDIISTEEDTKLIITDVVGEKMFRTKKYYLESDRENFEKQIDYDLFYKAEELKN